VRGGGDAEPASDASDDEAEAGSEAGEGASSDEEGGDAAPDVDVLTGNSITPGACGWGVGDGGHGGGAMWGWGLPFILARRHRLSGSPAHRLFARRARWGEAYQRTPEPASPPVPTPPSYFSALNN
jgi:hypothetical protein